MSYNETVMKNLLRSIPQKGKVEWIGIRSKKKEELSVVESVKVKKGKILLYSGLLRSNCGTGVEVSRGFSGLGLLPQ